MTNPMEWRDGDIDGCHIHPVRTFCDERGWLAEFFRHDELPDQLRPAMGYLSLTHPGVSRGPHEHEAQTDLFLFFDGLFRVYLWDDRAGSPTYRHRRRIDLGASNRSVVIVPPGVVHAYKNIGDDDALIINCPNALYAGEGKSEPVDEIRYEDQPESPFVMD